MTSEFSILMVLVLITESENRPICAGCAETVVPVIRKIITRPALIQPTIIFFILIFLESYPFNNAG
jgi:hypothetical protein